LPSRPGTSSRAQGTRVPLPREPAGGEGRRSLRHDRREAQRGHLFRISPLLPSLPRRTEEEARGGEE
jgi:hypothetical protein